MTSALSPPLKGIRVVELTRTILGPSCGMILADLGAEVVEVEPIDGDRTRRLRGFGGGFFGYFNRNKKSLALDEVVQMMGGLACMTGPIGPPLRAGAKLAVQ